MPEYPDQLVGGLAHRRGAGVDPGNRFEPTRFHLDGDEIDRQIGERQGLPGGGRKVPLTVIADATRRVINRVDPTSDVPFNFTLNPYRGCEHGCVYCYARPYHEFLGFTSGLDFETKIVAKLDAPALLRKELAEPSWQPEPIVMSAITDIYQAVEHEHRLARGCLEVMRDVGQPVATMTKSALILRDLDLWTELHGRGLASVTVTLVTLDDELARKLEPRATSASGRLGLVRRLTDAGLDVSVNVAPVIPGLTDIGVPKLLEAIADAGAKRIRWVALRLPHQLKAIFGDWLDREYPARAEHVRSLLRQTNGGQLYRAEGIRKRGTGRYAEATGRLIETFCQRYGLNEPHPTLRTDLFERPKPPQMELFE